MATESQTYLTDEMKATIRGEIRRYPMPRPVVLTALRLVQDEYRHVPPAAMQEIAEILEISVAEVQDTASFYHGVYSEEAIGKYRIWVCHSLSCSICGGEDLLAYLAEKLGIEPHDAPTTEDGVFTVEAAECLGLCDGAPAMIVEGDVYMKVTKDQVDEILDSYRAKV